MSRLKPRPTKPIDQIPCCNPRVAITSFRIAVRFTSSKKAHSRRNIFVRTGEEFLIERIPMFEYYARTEFPVQQY
jgi:hypothetical protein